MEIESFVFMLSIVLELIGAACVLACASTRKRRRSTNAEIGMIGCLCGLGAVTIVGAVLHMACGLVSGLAVMAIGLAVIFLAEGHAEENPFAAASGS